MSLTAGAKLGPYEIVAPLGAGAMGEVYRARDPRLGRDVAIKVLNDEAFGMADRRARFEREARAAAALNHPNIVALYDIGADEGRFYIVSELVEGESLRSRILRGQIPVREFYRIAVQLADGMAAAHAASITHRDLKPENIMLTTEGRVKILDFGLARQAAKADAAAAVSDSTSTQLDTQPGTVLGTVVYMSPEQVRGLAVDHRSDQFSFGVVLYEMATGKRPFASETHVQTMSAILTEEPKPIDAKIPAPLRWTIGRCLEKDVTARYDSSRDLYRDLSGQQEHLSDVLTAAEAAGPAGPAVALPAVPRGDSGGCEPLSPRRCCWAWERRAAPGGSVVTAPLAPLITGSRPWKCLGPIQRSGLVAQTARHSRTAPRSLECARSSCAI